MAGMKIKTLNSCLVFGFLIFLRFINESTAEETTKADLFLADLVTRSSRFPMCTLVFFQQDETGHYLETMLPRVVTRAGIIAYYSILQNHVLNNSSVVSRFPILPLNAYNRRAPSCKFGVITIGNDGMNDENLIGVKSIISPSYLPILRTESDPWIFLTPHPSQLERLLLSSALPAKTKYKLGLSLKNSKFVLQSVCFFCNDGAPKIINLPQKDPFKFEYYPDYVLNLHGKLLKLTMPAVKSRLEADPPYVGVNNMKRGVWKPHLEDFLIPKLNFTYTAFVSWGLGGEGPGIGLGAGGTGTQLKDGSWIGGVGDILDGRADMGLGVGITPVRISLLSFSNSFFDVSYLTFTTGHGTRIYSPMALLWPFDLLMWGCIGISTLAAFIFFKVLMKTMTLIGLDDVDVEAMGGFSRRGIVVREDWGLEHQIFFVGTTYLDQDCPMPRSTPLRCFVALWLFFTLIITTIYRSKMVSLLAFPILEPVPQTFDQLVATTDYTIGFLRHGDSAYNAIKASSDPVYSTLLKKMEVITGAGLECLDRVVKQANSKQKFACIAYAFSTVYIKARNLSDVDIRNLKVAQDTTFNIFLGIAFEAGSIYKESFERWMGWTVPLHLTATWEKMDMHNNVHLEKRKYWEATNQTDKLESSNSEDDGDILTFKSISGAFYALFGCLAICIGVLIPEIIYHRIIQRRKKWSRIKGKIRLVAIAGISGALCLFGCLGICVGVLIPEIIYHRIKKRRASLCRCFIASKYYC